MKNFKKQAIALIMIVATSLTSCSKDDNQPQKPELITKTSFVTTVTGPTTATPNQELTFIVTYAVDNKCGVFNSFVETTVTNTKQIEVKSKYEGNDCGTTAVTKTTEYKFKTSTEGTYILKFKKNATEFVTQTIVVKKAS